MTDELVERVAEAMRERAMQDADKVSLLKTPATWEDLAIPAIRIALEEAAKVAKNKSYGRSTLWPIDGYVEACDDIAAAIRTMIKD